MQSCVLQLNIEPGEKGLIALAGGVPSWIQFSDKEKVKVGVLERCKLRVFLNEPGHMRAQYEVHMNVPGSPPKSKCRQLLY
jgi:hypothetical protein